MAGDFHHFFLMETHIYQTSSPEFLKENISPFKSPHHQSTGNQGFPWISQPFSFYFHLSRKKTAKKSSPNQMLLPVPETTNRVLNVFLGCRELRCSPDLALKHGSPSGERWFHGKRWEKWVSIGMGGKGGFVTMVGFTGFFFFKFPPVRFDGVFFSNLFLGFWKVFELIFSSSNFWWGGRSFWGEGVGQNLDIT